MVRRFAREAGGTVSLESRPGIGTTVTLLLPVEARSLER
jgi:signal transduction histidine kinase